MNAELLTSAIHYRICPHCLFPLLIIICLHIGPRGFLIQFSQYLILHIIAYLEELDGESQLCAKRFSTCCLVKEGRGEGRKRKSWIFKSSAAQTTQWENETKEKGTKKRGSISFRWSQLSKPMPWVNRQQECDPPCLWRGRVEAGTNAKISPYPLSQELPSIKTLRKPRLSIQTDVDRSVFKQNIFQSLPRGTEVKLYLTVIGFPMARGAAAQNPAKGWAGDTGGKSQVNCCLLGSRLLVNGSEDRYLLRPLLQSLTSQIIPELTFLLALGSFTSLHPNCGSSKCHKIRFYHELIL